MAYVVGLTPDRLVSVGREGAAEILEEIHRQMDAGARRDETPVDPALRRLMELWPSLREWQRQSLVGIAREMTSDLAGP
ncbi:hypothetical protein AB0I81_40090 [Nonomuraea sp. NPDC050404]|uniref:hypothetical protein n=1 Tax=Nonomuraea sp. NPDC050404 TaxID=3155783 RepID=UPI0033E26533